MIVLGIDPGYERVGVAVVEKTPRTREKLLYSTCIETNARDPFEHRLLVIGSALKEVISTHRPDALAIEKLYFEKNQKTAMLVAEARGAMRYIASENRLPVYEYTPLEIKAAIASDGRADKKQMIRMVQQLVTLQGKIRHDDEYDAIATALTCLASAYTPRER